MANLVATGVPPGLIVTRGVVLGKLEGVVGDQDTLFITFTW